MTKLRRDDTDEARRFWRSVEQTSKEVEHWPAWKRSAQSLLVGTEASEPHPPSDGEEVAEPQPKSQVAGGSPEPRRAT
jgi:hypothetical protein